MVVMSNLAFNLLVGKRFFRKKKAFLNTEKFSIMIKIPNIK